MKFSASSEILSKSSELALFYLCYKGWFVLILFAKSKDFRRSSWSGSLCRAQCINSFIQLFLLAPPGSGIMPQIPTSLSFLGLNLLPFLRILKRSEVLSTSGAGRLIRNSSHFHPLCHCYPWQNNTSCRATCETESISFATSCKQESSGTVTQRKWWEWAWWNW